MSIGEFARRSRLSPKALRLDDGLGLLSPARVDELSGYRYYEGAQLEPARLIATLRQVGVPLTALKELLALDPAELAEQVTAFRQSAETRHAGQRELVTALVNRLTGRNTVMYEVSSREMPQRSLLCLKRNVDESGLWTFGKEFIAIIRDRWADAQGIDPKQLSLTPEDLGVRITYLASQPPSEKSAPDCDFAVPFA